VPLALVFHYLILNMFLMLIHPSSGSWDLFVELFHGLVFDLPLTSGSSTNQQQFTWYTPH